MEGDALTLQIDCPFIERMEEKKKLYPTGSPVLPATPQKGGRRLLPYLSGSLTS